MHRQEWIELCRARGHVGGLRSAAVRCQRVATEHYCDIVLQDFNNRMWESNRILKKGKQMKHEREALERAEYLADKVADAQTIACLAEDHLTVVGLDVYDRIGMTGLQHIAVATCRELSRHNRKHWDRHVPLRGEVPC